MQSPQIQTADWTTTLESYMAVSAKAKHMSSLGPSKSTRKVKVHVYKINCINTIN